MFDIPLRVGIDKMSGFQKIFWSIMWPVSFFLLIYFFATLMPKNEEKKMDINIQFNEKDLSEMKKIEDEFMVRLETLKEDCSVRSVTTTPKYSEVKTMRKVKGKIVSSKNRKKLNKK